jgi:hypothetical protein
VLHFFRANKACSECGATDNVTPACSVQKGEDGGGERCVFWFVVIVGIIIDSIRNNILIT